MLHVHGQRLFHHDVDVFRGAHFNNPSMFECAGKSRNGLDVGFREQIIEARIEQIRIQFESLGVARDEIRLRFDNAGELNAEDLMNAGDEASRVVMRQADDGEPDWLSLLGRRGRRNCDYDQEREEKPFHGEQIMRFSQESKDKIGEKTNASCESPNFARYTLAYEIKDRKPMNANSRVLCRMFFCVPALAICLSARLAAGADENSAKAQSHFARLGTNKVHYLTQGQGTNALVFIHGWGCNAGFWREQVPAFADKAKLVMIDLPGHGESDKPEVDYTMEYFADAVIAVMRDAKVEKATLVGHSMGTPVMCKVYAKAPERVAGLVAVDGFLRRPKVNAEQAEAMAAPYRKPDYREQVKQMLGFMFPNPGTEALRERVTEEMLKTPQHVMASAMGEMFNLKQPAWDLAKVDVPVMSINAKSPMWTENYEKYVRSLSAKTDYRLIEGTGHFVMLEKPREFNTTLNEMLAKFDLLAK
jgi:pimeloyl-ACP methyl ester carboxylesterase